MEILLNEKRKGIKEESKKVNIESPPKETEDKLEIGYKSKSDEEGESANSGNGSNSSPNDDDLDIPIRVGGKFQINVEVTRKRL